MTDFSPTHLHNFRAATDTMAKSPLAGGMRFLCPECHTSQPLKGRRARGYKVGFRCAECVAKRGSKK